MMSNVFVDARLVCIEANSGNVSDGYINVAKHYWLKLNTCHCLRCRNLINIYWFDPVRSRIYYTHLQYLAQYAQIAAGVQNQPILATNCFTAG